MQMPSISIVAIGSAAIVPLAGLLRYLLKRPLKVASTSEELLDLFEDRCAVLEEQASSTSRSIDVSPRAAPRFSVPGEAMAILAAWRPYVSRRAHLAQARLAKVRASHLHRSQLGAYEKARVERYLNEIRVGRMTYQKAQQAIAAEWIAAYRPIMHGRGLRSR